MFGFNLRIRDFVFRSLPFLCVAVAGLLSIQAHAAIVWAIPSGDSPGSSSQGAADLLLTGTDPGDFLIEVFMDTEGEQVHGWDLTIMSDGLGVIGEVTGPLLGSGASQPDGSYRQFGSADLALSPLTGSAVHLMTFRWTGFSTPESIRLSPSSNFVDQGFSTVFFAEKTLAVASSAPVPLPAAMYLFCASLASLSMLRRRKSC